MSSYKEAQVRRESSFAKTCGYSTIADITDQSLSKIFRERPDFYAGNIAEDFHIICRLKVAASPNAGIDSTLCVAENGDSCPLMYVPQDKIPSNLVFKIQMAISQDKRDAQKLMKKSGLREFIKRILFL